MRREVFDFGFLSDPQNSQNSGSGYLRPGKVLEMPGLPAGSVRIYVLGPPRDSERLYRKDPRTGESYDPALASATVSASKFLDALNRPGSRERLR